MGVESYLSNQISTLSIATAANDMPSEGTRYMGGHNRQNQPYINGYHQIVVFPPTGIFTGDKGVVNQWLSSTCEGFTPHSITTNFVDVLGQGQIGASFPSGRTVNREFTLTFREYRSLPILNIFRTWHSLFDPHLGMATLTAANLLPVNYKGMIIVGILKPTMNDKGLITNDDVEEVYCYEGVFPSSLPDDTITTIDQATQDVVQASVTFKFDGAPLDKGFGGGTEQTLLKKYVTLLNTREYNNTYKFNIGANLPTVLPTDFIYT